MSIPTMISAQWDKPRMWKKVLLRLITANRILISEYNGHMYPTKSYDWEEHRVWHAMRHVNVLDTVAGKRIAGSFGWCMFDYNTHKDFGGDCVSVITVWWTCSGNPGNLRNFAVYACQQEKRMQCRNQSSSMDIREHPGCNHGTIWIFTNADSVRMYKWLEF